MLSSLPPTACRGRFYYFFRSYGPKLSNLKISNVNSSNAFLRVIDIMLSKWSSSSQSRIKYLFSYDKIVLYTKIKRPKGR